MSTYMSNIKKLYSQSLELYQKEKFKDIVQQYDVLIKNFQKDITILNILGLSLVNEKEFLKATNVFEKIKLVDPIHPNINANLGNLYRLTSQYDKSIKCLIEAIQSNPNNFNSYYNIALAYYSSGNIILSLRNFELSLNYVNEESIKIINDICKTYLGILIDIGKTDEAFKIGKDLLKKFPDSSIINYKLANLYSWRNQYSKSINLYREALKFDPNNKSIKFDLALSLKKEGIYEECLSILKDLDFQQSKAVYIETLFQLGEKKDFLRELDFASKNFKGNRVLANLSKYTSYLYNQKDEYPFCNDPFKFIYARNVLKPDLVKDVLKELDSLELDLMNQDLLINGTQSAGNLFKFNLPNLNKLKDMIKEEIENYRNIFSHENEYFINNWPTNSSLKSWYIDLKEGGSLDYHYHHAGWLSGSVYLNMPETSKVEEGSIQFGFNNRNYKFIKNLPIRIYKPKEGDILLFPSSLNHRVNPFGKTIAGNRRVSLAFDLLPIE